jgi:energy-coupling factor transporter ATP-binding protein EcfA2
VLAFLRRSVRELGQTVVMVTHDPTAASYADRVLFLADGRVVDELADPDGRVGAGADEGVRHHGGPSRWRAEVYRLTLRSLLSHKLRLALSGSPSCWAWPSCPGPMIFTDTLSKTFNDLFASNAADVNIEPQRRSRWGLAGTGGTAAQEHVPQEVVDRVPTSTASRRSAATCRPRASTSSIRTARSSTPAAHPDRHQLGGRPPHHSDDPVEGRGPDEAG